MVKTFKQLNELLDTSKKGGGSDDWKLHKAQSIRSEGEIFPVKLHPTKAHYNPGGGDGRYSDTWTIIHKPTGIRHHIYHNSGDMRIRIENGKGKNSPEVTAALKHHLENE